MMDSKEIGEFFKAHLRRFGYLKPEQAGDFGQALCAMNATAAEAEDASFLMTCRGLPAQHAGNLKCLLDTIGESRRAKGQGQPETVRPHCAACESSGWIEVPHRRAIDHGGGWDGKTTMAVACRCNGQPPPRCEGIDAYERDFPFWRDMMAAGADRRLAAKGVRPALYRQECDFLADRAQRGEITWQEARRLISEAYREMTKEHEAERERERQAELAARDAELRRVEAELRRQADARRSTFEALGSPPSSASA